MKELKAKEKEWAQVAAKDKGENICLLLYLFEEFLAKAKRLDDDLSYMEKKRKEYDLEHEELEKKMQRLKQLKEDVAKQETEYQTK